MQNLETHPRCAVAAVMTVSSFRQASNTGHVGLRTVKRKRSISWSFSATLMLLTSGAFVSSGGRSPAAPGGSLTCFLLPTAGPAPEDPAATAAQRSSLYRSHCFILTAGPECVRAAVRERLEEQRRHRCM